MNGTLKHQPSMERSEPTTRLQIRVLYRDRAGSISDVTQDDGREGRGLADLQERSACASFGLCRTRELLELLALAAENRELIDAVLVRRVLSELETELSHSGDLGHYVRYTEALFEDALALPRISVIRPDAIPYRTSLKTAS